MPTVTTEHSKYKGVIVNTTDMRKLKAWVNRKIQDIIDVLVFRLTQIGEECVKIAREPHANDYNDITGNLRSSIGYMVMVNGKPVVGGDFVAQTVAPGVRTIKTKDGKTVNQKVGGDGAEGVKQGEKLLHTLQADYPSGVVLIVCAGMSYAAYVEHIHHKDVLTSAELVAKDLMRKLLGGMLQ